MAGEGIGDPQGLGHGGVLTAYRVPANASVHLLTRLEESLVTLLSAVSQRIRPVETGGLAGMAWNGCGEMETNFLAAGASFTAATSHHPRVWETRAPAMRHRLSRHSRGEISSTLISTASAAVR